MKSSTLSLLSRTNLPAKGLENMYDSRWPLHEQAVSTTDRSDNLFILQTSKRSYSDPGPTTWAVIWGGPKGRGEENVPENALSRKFLDPSKRASVLLCRGCLYRKNRALIPEGSGKRTVRGGVQNPFLGGVSFVRFSSRFFFHPPHGVL